MFEPTTISDPITLYDINQLVDFVNRTRNNYYNITGSDMLDQVLQNRNTTTGEIVPISGFSISEGSNIAHEFILNSTSLGPFDDPVATI